MINNEQSGSLNATILLLWLKAAVKKMLPPYESEVYYTLIEGNNVMHFKNRQSYWKELVRGAINSDRGQSCDAFQAILLEETCPRCNTVRLYEFLTMTFYSSEFE